MNRSGSLTLLLTLLPLLGWASQPSASAQSVVIKPEAQISDSLVRVADIAQLSDFPQGLAETLGQLEVTQLDGPTGLIKSEQLLGVILTQNLSRETLLKITISGAATCKITKESPTPTLPSAAPTPDKTNQTPALVSNQALQVTSELQADKNLPPTSSTTPETAVPKTPATPETPNTLSALIQTEIYAQIQAPQENIRIRFDTTNPLLGQKLLPGQKWQIHSLNKWVLGSRQWDVQLVEKSKTLALLHVQATVLQKMTGLVAIKDIPRGTILQAQHFSTEERWMDRINKDQQLTSQDVLGQEAIRPIGSGNPLDLRDLKPAELVTKGQTTTVYVVRGDLKIKMTAKALDSGKLHDQIGLRCSTYSDKPADKAKNVEQLGERFEATIIGRGLAVIGSVDPQIETQLREQK